MSQVIYGLICDGGDGSASLYWFQDKDLVDRLLDDDENFYLNEGSPAEILALPDDLDLATAGFCIQTSWDDY